MTIIFKRFPSQAALQRQQEEQNVESRRQAMAGSVVQNADGSAEPKTKIQVRFPKGQRVGVVLFEIFFGEKGDWEGLGKLKHI